MRTPVILFVFLLAGIVPAVSPAAASRHKPYHSAAHHRAAYHRVLRRHYAPRRRPAVIRVAPADEYFGRMKMSILGIRNQLRDLALRLQYAPDKSEDVLGSAAMVEDAMLDWERKYPSDPWLPKSVYDLTSLYANVHTPHGHERAAHALRWLLKRYGRTRYGAQARTQFKAQVGLR